jgi:zinc protease
VLADFLKNGVDQTAFDRIKRQLRADEIYARDNVDGLARDYGSALTSGLTVADVQAWPDILQAVKPEDVLAAARDVLNRNNAVTGWLERPDAPKAEVSQ